MTSTNPTPETSVLYLVRHGATDANQQRPHILQGSGIDFSLNETGRQQAELVAGFFGKIAVRAVYSSSLLRSVETARIIADPHDLPVTKIPEIAEVNVGEWEGKSWDAIMREFPNEYREFMEDPATHPYVGGETHRDVLQRVKPVFDALLKRHAGERVVVVGHSVVNRVYLASLLQLELRNSRLIRQTNTGINVIQQRGKETELVTLNADFHLAEIFLGV